MARQASSEAPHIQFSQEICDLLSIIHSIARLKKQMSTYSNQLYKDTLNDYRYGCRSKQVKYVHIDAQLRAQRRAIETQIVTLLKPLNYPTRDGWVKFIETSTDGHALLQSIAAKLVEKGREIETGYLMLIKPFKEQSRLKREIEDTEARLYKLRLNLAETRNILSSAAQSIDYNYVY